MFKKVTKISSLVLLFGGIVFSSCAPKYTASFNNSREFYKDEKQVVKTDDQKTIKEENVSEIKPEETMVASTNKSVVAQLAEIPSIKKIVEEHKENVANLKSSELDQKELKKEIRKEEKRAHKEVKKQLVREIKEIKSVKDTDSSQAMNKKVFIGIVIAAAGIVIAILASGGLGAVAIIVGVGLIAWGLIEQGGV
ncbi:hypothetical protein [Fulvivirga sedimenti]|uniref:Lipoprotein n=1 Tax=Fulvivirga sedimenti TaxID=2879465 RepID=A0A9X1HR71_9BACT|nr:hypothetical protein [Fulvivirga sedimenti]MCA6075338.1 hypothetical protein [Fulvivirga sedimenti]MCA6076515.1 hypothetical protein [Fulvivirga sedimenti]MCA6077643.1 hypothetical protein [Fulvivirga sedimenti]